MEIYSIYEKYLHVPSVAELMPWQPSCEIVMFFFHIVAAHKMNFNLLRLNTDTFVYIVCIMRCYMYMNLRISDVGYIANYICVAVVPGRWPVCLHELYVNEFV